MQLDFYFLEYQLVISTKGWIANSEAVQQEPVVLIGSCCIMTFPLFEKLDCTLLRKDTI